jgi:molybdenum cofactor cytidylyltransferase
VLAAGFSSRAGAFKPALPLAGRAVLHRVLDAFAPVVDGVFVVTGHERARVENLVAEWIAEYTEYNGAERAASFCARTVYNPDYAKEMMTSVLAGARAVPRGSFLFIVPADYPLITAEVTRGLRNHALRAELHRDGEKPDVFIPRHNGKNGHPVLLAPESLAALQASASPSLKEFLSARRRVYIDVDNAGVLEDLDTPEDYARIEKMLREKDCI